MSKPRLNHLSTCILLLVIPLSSHAQQQSSRPTVCKQEVMAALRALPRLEYACRADAANDYDEAILRWPERRRAINGYLRALERLSASDWWDARVDDLNVCYFLGRPGAMSAEERERFAGGDYPVSLFGNDRIRLILVADPCYQTGYGGSNAFLLYRTAGRVRVTQALDGYFSRADNSVSLDFARSRSGQVIEISTSTGGLNPYITNYYFTIDRRTKRAVPLKLFKEGRRRTHKITTAMIMSETSYTALEVIKGGRLAKSFDVYEDDAEGKIDDGGRTLRRRVYRWNGRFYESQYRLP